MSLDKKCVFHMPDPHPFTRHKHTDHVESIDLTRTAVAVDSPARMVSGNASVDMVHLELDLPMDRTNPNGGCISLGHPVGASGAILTLKALYELQRTGGRYALVSLCIGGGQGIAAIFERL